MSDGQTVSTPRSILAFCNRWRLYLVLALGSILALLLFLYAGHWLLRKITINTLLGQSQEAADTAGRVIEGRLSEARVAVESFAADPVTVDVWMRRDIQHLTGRLREAHDLEREVTFWGIYDSRGHLRVAYPQSGTDLSGNVGASDWFARA